MMNNGNTIKNVKRNILLLFSGRFVSDFGTALFRFSLSLYVLDITGSSALFSLILTLSILPGILISIFAGALIDKYDKKKIIFIADLLSAISAGALFIILEVLSERIVFLGIGVVIVSLVQTFLNLGINSGVGNMVTEDLIPKVNAYFQAMGATLSILGPVIGAVCYDFLGIKLVLLIDAITYIIGAITTLLMEFVYHDSGKEETFSLKQSVQYIFTYVKKYGEVKMLMVMLFILTMIYYPLTNLALQNIMRVTVKASELQLSFTVAATGIGVIIGALTISSIKIEKALAQLPKKLGILASFITLWIFPILCYMNMDWSKSRNQIITGMFFVIMLGMGCIYTRMVIPSYSYMQMYVEENLRGRIFGLATSALNIAGPIGLVLFGMLMELKVDIVIMIASAFIIALFAVIMKSRIAQDNMFQEEKK